MTHEITIRTLWDSTVTLKSYTSDRGTFASTTVDVDGAAPLNVLLDPQPLVDALAELFPDVKPSPPKPKVGDTVAVKDHNIRGVVRYYGPELAVLACSNGSELVFNHAHREEALTVIERGES